jgi:hypothetical protein
MQYSQNTTWRSREWQALLELTRTHYCLLSTSTNLVRSALQLLATQLTEQFFMEETWTFYLKPP